MNGTSKITLAYLKELGACREGQREFQRAFPDGGEYQEVLDRCAEEDRVDLGRWLLEHVGPTEDVRVYEEAIDDADKNIIFAGGLDFRAEVKIRSLLSGCGIKAGRGIQAGWGIEAGRGIKAGRGIQAGCGIEAGDGIKAGWGIEAGYGIKAGRGIKAGLGIEAGRGIQAGYGIKAGDGIKAGWGIEAGRGIKAGLGIEAGRGIQAGYDFFIFAGLNVRKSEWEHRAIVTANAKPENLMSGCWRPKENMT